MPDTTGLHDIQYGLYFGECIGYCRDSIFITPEKITYTKQSNISGGDLPDKILEMKTSATLWNELSQAVDWKVFRPLPAQIGQPDAADQGGEYVEIRVGGDAKRVDFEQGQNIAELARVLEILRRLRADLAVQFQE